MSAPRGLRGGLSLACWLALLASAPPVAAQLSWSAPDDACPTESEVRAELARRLAAAGAEPLPATVVVTATSRGHSLLVQTTREGARHERRLETTTCSEAAEAAIVILALAAGASAEQAAGAAGGTAPANPPAEPEPAEPEPAEPEPAPEPEPQTPPRTEPSATRAAPAAAEAQIPAEKPARDAAPLELGARAHAGIAVGALPELGPSFAVGPSLGRQAWRLEAQLRYLLPQTGRAAPNQGGTLRLLAGALGACGTVPVASGWAAAGCGGVELGRLSGRGEGVSDPETAHSPWLALEAGPELAWRPLGWLELGLQARVNVPFLRTRYVLDDLGTVHRPAAVGLRAGLFVGVHFR